MKRKHRRTAVDYAAPLLAAANDATEAIARGDDPADAIQEAADRHRVHADDLDDYLTRIEEPDDRDRTANYNTRARVNSENRRKRP